MYPSHRPPPWRRVGRRARLAGLGLALIATVAACGSSSSSAPTTIGQFRGVSQVPAALLDKPAPHMRQTDVRGGTLDTSSLRGKPYAVTFLYANCPDVCPLITSEIVEALGKMGASARRVAVVAVSVDPRGDTAANVDAFLRRHRAPANFHYLIGSESQLQPIWRSYFAAPQIQGDPNSAHTAAVWLVDGEGRLRAKFDAGLAFNTDDLAHDMTQLLART
ncbi:MAG TPA: SCO family protein [Conexibacter sp.]|jgi:protein SCO1/2